MHICTYAYIHINHDFFRCLKTSTNVGKLFAYSMGAFYSLPEPPKCLIMKTKPNATSVVVFLVPVSSLLTAYWILGK